MKTRKPFLVAFMGYICHVFPILNLRRMLIVFFNDAIIYNVI